MVRFHWRTVAVMICLGNSLLEELIHLPYVWHVSPEVVCIPFREFNSMHRLIASVNGVILELELFYLESTAI